MINYNVEGVEKMKRIEQRRGGEATRGVMAQTTERGGDVFKRRGRPSKPTRPILSTRIENLPGGGYPGGGFNIM